MTLPDAVRERLTAAFPNLLGPKLINDIMSELAPVLEQAQRELPATEAAIADAANAVAEVARRTSHLPTRKRLDAASDYLVRYATEQAQGAQTPTGMLRELVTFATSERDKAHALVLACGNDIERSRPYFARVQAFAEVLAWAGEPKRSPVRIDPLPSPPADPGGGS